MRSELCNDELLKEQRCVDSRNRSLTRENDDIQKELKEQRCVDSRNRSLTRESDDTQKELNSFLENLRG